LGLFCFQYRINLTGFMIFNVGEGEAKPNAYRRKVIKSCTLLPTGLIHIQYQ
jgi:hypothetical protein